MPRVWGSAMPCARPALAGAAIEAGKVIWLIGPFEVAAVDQQGVVRTFRQGSARVLVRVGSKVGYADLTVTPKPPVSVEVSAEPAELVPGGITLVKAVPLT